MKTKHFFLFISILLGAVLVQAQNDSFIVLGNDTSQMIINSNPESLDKNVVIIDTIDKSQSTTIVKHPKKKWIAALLAFPLPFGVVGLHRIYLGTLPYIPLVYVGTVGGVFGLLPLADFIAILNSKEEDLQNFNTGKVFFWIKK